MVSTFCSLCNRAAPRPVLICPECPETPTYYCDTQCRDRDQANHRKDCNDPTRKLIYRAGDLLQKIFFTFRETAFDTDISHVEKDGDVLRVHEGENQVDPSHGPLFRFPGHLVPVSSDKEKLLSSVSCTDAVAYTLELSKILLEDISLTIEEPHWCRLRNPHSTTRHLPNGTPDATQYMHSTLAIECADDKAYILDLAGAQNDQFNPVVPFDIFCRQEAKEIYMLFPHDQQLDRFERMVEGSCTEADEFDRRSRPVLHHVHQRMLQSVKEWEEQNSMTTKQLIRMDLPIYTQYRTSLLEKLDFDLRTCVARWEMDGRPVVTFRRSRPSEFLSPEESRRLRCTVKPRGHGSHAYRKWKADELRRQLGGW